MSKFSKIIVLSAFFAGFMLFACSESDLKDEFSDIVGTETSSSSTISDNPGISSSSGIVGSTTSSSSGTGIGLSSSGQGGNITLPDNMAQRDGKCYVCNTARSECATEWNNWIKEKCSNNNTSSNEMEHWCSEVSCPNVGTPSSSSGTNTSSSSSLRPSSSSAVQSSSSAGRTQTTTCPIGNLVQLGSVPANPYTACFEYQGSCYTCKIESESNGNTCASSWVWTTNGANDNIGKTNYWYQKVTCPAGVGGGTSSSSQAIVQSSSSQGTVPTYPVLQEGQSGVQKGYATRYWDACKPHCSWGGHSQALGRVNKICNISGQEISGIDTQSSCDGGAAYTCLSQAPIKANDNVSYAFAATPGGGNDCGKCYQLQFTGICDEQGGKYPPQQCQSVKGKTLIVIASNVGYDVSGGQFDVMIPGGGVGAFDAFTNQLRNMGVTNPNMGAQYGGFLAGCNYDKACVKQRCSSHFSNNADLKRGCDWFVDWMDAANNPNVLYKEVTCPQYLIDNYKSTK